MMLEMPPPDCQIKGLVQMSESLTWIEVAWQLRHKVKRVVKRRLRYIRNRFNSHRRIHKAPTGKKNPNKGQPLVAGQRVKVRSREEIQATLDHWNYLKGCGFMEEMWPYCNTIHRVYKPVHRFIDERDHRLKKTRGIVFLEGVHCEGTIDYGVCDRNCYFFWREEWLEKVE
jgi:hypothetical protein